jgi:hypothetical protein
MSRPEHNAILNVEQLEERLALDATSFVKNLYSNVLKRSTPPSASEVSYWVNQISSQPDYGRVATAIWESQEHRVVELISYYNTYLHRAADSSGMSYWLNNFNGEFNVQVGFLFSPEYVAAHNTTDLYIQALYLDVLGRQDNGQEQSFWEGQMNQVGAKQVASDILGSTESYTDIITVYYNNFLGRTPDSNGLSNWLTQLQNGSGTLESVAIGILSSAEFQAKPAPPGW